MASSCAGVLTKPIPPTKTAMASIARHTITFRPKRSPMAPQSGAEIVAESGAAAKQRPAQRLMEASPSTPISSRRLGKNGRKLIIPIEVIRLAVHTTQYVRFQ